MKIFGSIVFSLIISLVISACNSDVFIDGPDSPTEKEFYIEGDGGEISFNISRKGLVRISIDHVSDDRGYTYYNSNGEEIPEKSPVSELARIHYENRWIMYDVEIEGDKLTFKSIENCQDILNHTIRLEYDYTTRFILVNTTAGLQTEVLRVEYDKTLGNIDNSQTRTKTLTVNNSSSNPTTIGIKPYIGIQSAGIVEPEERWARYLKLKMPVPTFVEGKWLLTDDKEITLASSLYYFTPDWDISTDVEIPANKKADILTTVTMSKLNAHGMIEYVNPISERHFTTSFTCTFVEPIDYDINLIYE